MNEARFPVPDAGRPIAGVSFVHVKPVAVPVNVTAAVVVPAQSSWLVIALTTGVGCTVIVKTFTGPLHVTAPNVYLGVMVIVAVTGVVPALVAVKAAMLPVPLAASPIEAVLFVQSYDVAVPVKLMAAVLVPLQTVWFAGVFAAGVGFTVIVNDVVAPVHAP